MRRGLFKLIRRTALGRRVLYHANTVLFWLYGLMTFWLAFLLSEIWLTSTTARLGLSLALGMVAAFSLPYAIHRLVGRRFRSPWCDTFVIILFAIAILVTGYAHDVRNSRPDAPKRLAILSVRSLCLHGELLGVTTKN